jgi:hypothetical protein
MAINRQPLGGTMTTESKPLQYPLRREVPGHPELVCDLSLLSRPERDRLMELTAELFGGVQEVYEVNELSDGYEFRYPDASGELIAKLAEWISLDRKCCSFLKHGIFTEPHRDHAWLHLTGPVGAKESLAADIERLLPDGVALHELRVSD